MIGDPEGVRMAAATTFVLVHGAWHGGWCWSRVASLLRGRGHRVLAPTQTGLGERSHLLSGSIDLDVFVTDILNVLVWEELTDVVLVGHSFGGIAINGVADRAADRLRRLVYLDALMLEDGQSAFSRLPPDVVEARLRDARRSSGGLSLPPPPAGSFGVAEPEQAAWVERRLTPHPLATYTSPLRLGQPVGNGLPTGYVVCTEPLYAPLAASRDWVAAHGWRTTAIPTGHDAMVTAPDLLADLLEAEGARD
jgi:pimeloyl-ACP methyl ester carboxylesterase